MSQHACLKIRELSREIVRELDLLGDPHPRLEVTPGQLHALVELHRHKSLGVGELGKLLRVDKSVASRLLATLEERAWISSRESKDDSRRKHFHLTPAGDQKVAEINDFCGDVTSEALSRLSKAEKEQLQRSLALYVNALRSVRRKRSVILRPLRKTDGKALSRIIESVDGEFGIVRECGHTSSQFQDFRQKNALYIVAEMDDQVCGGGGIVPRSTGTIAECELQKLYLAKEARGLGVGSQLLHECLKTAQRFGYRTCYALTSRRFTNAISLYERNGFKKTDLPADHKHSSCNLLYVRDL